MPRQEKRDTAGEPKGSDSPSTMPDQLKKHFKENVLKYVAATGLAGILWVGTLVYGSLEQEYLDYVEAKLAGRLRDKGGELFNAFEENLAKRLLERDAQNSLKFKSEVASSVIAIANMMNRRGSQIFLGNSAPVNGGTAFRNPVAHELTLVVPAGRKVVLHVRLLSTSSTASEVVITSGTRNLPPLPFEASDPSHEITIDYSVDQSARDSLGSVPGITVRPEQSVHSELRTITFRLSEKDQEQSKSIGIRYIAEVR